MAVELLDISAEDYHADLDGPSLNSGTCKKLLLETPAHAAASHPRLSQVEYQPTYSDALDEGTALHQMLLGDDRVDILDFDAFRSGEAKEARDASRAAGRVPMLRKKWDEISAVGESLKKQVAAFPIDPPLFTDGYAEQTFRWQEGDVKLRARLDWLRKDYRCIDDLKKARTAQPRQFQRALFSYGYDIQAAFYVRAVKATFGVEPIFRWVAIEPLSPYAMSVHVLSPAAMRAAQLKVDLAIDLWRECLSSGVWPAYPQLVSMVEQPAWMQAVEWDDSALTEVPF